MAFKAVALPRLMQARSDVITKEVRTARMGIFHPGATWDNQRLPGRPLSRANDHSCLEAVATSLMQQDVRQTMTIPTIKFVAKYDRVPLKKTWMNGCPSAVSLIATRSGPTVKQRVMAIRKPKAAFGPTVHIIALGIVIEASWSSSDMCTEQSYPIKAVNGAVNPIIDESPVVGQPPLFSKWNRTSDAFPRGARTHIGMNTAKKPARWRIKIQPSTKGSRTARKVLKKMAKTMMPMVSKVACHASKPYVSSFSAMRPWMMPPTMKATEARNTCQPTAQSQPVV